jgi:hypothetical protein
MSDPLFGSLRRRREAARPLRPLTCGCRDPLFCDCWPPLTERPPLTEKMIDGGRAAALHLLNAGYPPLLQLDTLRALQKGGTDRELVRQLTPWSAVTDERRRGGPRQSHR